MSVNLQLLGLTAIPRLSKKYKIQVDYFLERTLFGVSPEEFQKTFENVRKILAMFFEKFSISWWDVYYNSDIGMERLALAQEMQLDKRDVVLDVGCGRGYFTIAAAKFSGMVVGLDLMNGLGRYGWWRNFKESICELNLSHKVLGVKSDARKIPFKDSSFTVATAVHSIRNFRNEDCIEKAIREMKRIVVKNGNVIIVENIPVARTKAQEAHLELFRCKAKYTKGELYFLPEEQLVKMFQKVGFREVEVKELDYNLSAAPPFFCLDVHLPSIPKNEREKAIKSYNKALAMIRKWGEASPPALLIKATK